MTSSDPAEQHELAAPDVVWERLSARVAAEAGTERLQGVAPVAPPDWDAVAPGVSFKPLAHDAARGRISLLVRLQPGVHYPPHEHAELEELHLLQGELWINDRKLVPGDYHLAVAGSADRRVWSETGCTCVLITSTHDRMTPHPGI